LEGVEQPKKLLKTPENALSDALLMSLVQNFAAGDAKQKPRSVRPFGARQLRCGAIRRRVHEINYVTA